MDIVKSIANVFRLPFLVDKDKFDSGVDALSHSLGNMWNKLTGNALTDADLQASYLRREESKFQNDLQRQNIVDQYGLQVEGMQKAGLNPAMMYSGGSIGSGTGNVASPVGASSAGYGEGLSTLIGALTNLIMQKESNKTSRAIASMNNETQLRLQKNEQEFQFPFLKSNQALTDFQAKGQEILNNIESQVSQYRITQIRNDAMMSGEQLATARQYRSNLIDTAMYIRAQTGNEYLRQGLTLAEQALTRAQSWQIYRLAPVQRTLLEKQSLLTNEQYIGAYNDNKFLFPIQKAMYEMDRDTKQLQYHWNRYLMTSKESGPKLWRKMQYGLGQVLTFGVGAAGVGAAIGGKFSRSTPTQVVVNPYSTFGNANW